MTSVQYLLGENFSIYTFFMGLSVMVFNFIAIKLVQRKPMLLLYHVVHGVAL